MNNTKLPRVWDKVTKEMMSPAKWEEDYVGGGDRKIGLFIYRSKKHLSDHSSLSWVIRHPESFDVMYPTGLVDIHGKEIYKGDKVIAGNRGTGMVEWLNGGYITRFDARRYELINNHVEIIGNIYENPLDK